MTNLFEGTFIDPFNLDGSPPYIVIFDTGMVATTAVEGSLTGALQKGAEIASKFVKERDETTSSSKSFYDPIQKSNLKTMLEMNKSVKIRARNIFEWGGNLALTLSYEYIKEGTFAESSFI